MRKSLLLIVMALLSVSASAQKFALIDMEYIMEQIPAYQRATEQLDQSSKVWQAEIERVSDEAKQLYENYQRDAKNLTDAQRTQREEAIINKEKEVAELRRNYFGPEGEMAKKQNALLQPIEDEVYEAVKAIALKEGYAAVLDRASATSLIFASPDIDISNEVLIKLGYSN
ncbi:MAG: OmpH family outer membrane protein [Mediterranea massiliensis]|nr:OmpH family outer membrane protein [Mediterranea massiliensis]MBO5381404.1 OmpH family outer membrane protein [Bacteroides sp.]MBR4048652.1 OmpH family outer membrane protein [Bacteroides sp.]